VRLYVCQNGANRRRDSIPNSSMAVGLDSAKYFLIFKLLA
jgi:hypothetical protein